MRLKNRTLLLILAIAVLCLASVRTEAGMYRCVDTSGSVSFTNVPAAENCRLLGEEWGTSALAKPDGWYLPGGTFNFSGHYDTDSSLYDRHIKIICMRYGVDPYLVKAIIRAESDFDRNAISSKGAKGLMQLMPGTARDLNVVNPFDPRENIEGGVRYLRMILDAFNGNLLLSLAAYNAGPNLVKRYQKIPAIPETIEYVKRVLTYYRNYRGGNVGRISMPSTGNTREIVSVN
jgi:Transglycosylase SLT domain/Domain of unknown function (DUF4124)